MYKKIYKWIENDSRISTIIFYLSFFLLIIIKTTTKLIITTAIIIGNIIGNKLLFVPVEEIFSIETLLYNNLIWVSLLTITLDNSSYTSSFTWYPTNSYPSMVSTASTFTSSFSLTVYSSTELENVTV